MLDEKYKFQMYKNDLYDSTWTSAGDVLSYDVFKESMVNSYNNYVEGYFYSLPSNLNIFENVEKYLSKINDNKIKDFLIEFMHTFQEILIEKMTKVGIYNYLPQMTVEEQDEESIFLEWIFKDFRIGFSFEKKVDDSTWYMITNKNLEEFIVSGSLNKENVYITALKTINYALENS